jgi:hypothetical protein
MLGSADLQDWADEGDLVRAEIRLLPVVARFASDPGPAQITLGNDLSGRLRAFMSGRDLNAEALRCLLADLVVAGGNAAEKGQKPSQCAPGESGKRERPRSLHLHLRAP